MLKFLQTTHTGRKDSNEKCWELMEVERRD